MKNTERKRRGEKRRKENFFFLPSFFPPSLPFSFVSFISSVPLCEKWE